MPCSHENSESFERFRLAKEHEGEAHSNTAKELNDEIETLKSQKAGEFAPFGSSFINVTEIQKEKDSLSEQITVCGSEKGNMEKEILTLTEDKEDCNAGVSDLESWFHTQKHSTNPRSESH